MIETEVSEQSTLDTESMSSRRTEGYFMVALMEAVISSVALMEAYRRMISVLGVMGWTLVAGTESAADWSEAAATFRAEERTGPRIIRGVAGVRVEAGTEETTGAAEVRDERTRAVEATVLMKECIIAVKSMKAKRMEERMFEGKRQKRDRKELWNRNQKTVRPMRMKNEK